ncbi:hypothetical protein FRC0077_01966 [Corynebacterium diphtheriae]|nr:hypothetical protein FRC0076_01957 [Corynebacterium diphtheriae]CAB0710386.1 hypothetical protein FRC0077_01966 [Corynebacterium diphtheriae]
MNKRRKDILAYFDTKSMHSKTGRATKRGYFAGFFLALHTKSLSDRPFEQIWCEVPSFSGVNGGNLPANPSQSQPSHDCENVPLRVEPRPNPRRTNQRTLKPEEPLNGGISQDFSPNFTPNRFQTGRLSRFGVKCRLFRGWTGVARPPTPTNATNATPPTSDTKSMHPKTGRADKFAGPIFRYAGARRNPA